MIMRWIAVLSVLTLVGCGSAPYQTAAELDPTFESRVELSRDWTRKLQENSGFPMRQPFTPVVIANAVYAVINTGALAQMSLTTGQLEAQWDLGESVSIGLATDGTSLYWGSENGDMVAMDLSGNELWRARLTSRALSLPIIVGSVVYVQTQDGYLVALDQKTGQQLWVYDDGVPRLTLHGDASPVVANGQLMTSFASGRVVSFDPATGDQLWSQNVGQISGRSDLERLNDADGSPVIVNGTLLLASSYQGETLLIDTQTGRTLTRYNVGSRHGVVPFADTLVIIDNDDVIVGVSPKNGEQLWSIDSLKYRRLTDAVNWQGLVAFGDSFGWLHLVDPVSGDLVARFPSDHLGLSGKPVVEGNILLVQGDSGRLKAFSILGR